jgi:small subunit ribosomal protein S17
MSGKVDCKDSKCPFHGGLRVRGRVLEGRVASLKQQKSAVVEVNYIASVKKFQRFEKRRSRIHVHVPDCLKVRVGSLVEISSCRRLSKTISFVITKVLSF